MHTELPRLPRTTRKQRPEDSSVQSSLGRCIHHIHVRRPLGLAHFFPRAYILARASPSSFVRSVGFSQIGMVHWYYGFYARTEHALPFLLSYGFTVVCSGNRFGGPFLLVVCSIRGGGKFGTREVVEVVFVP